jgi:hypothetical protein
MSWAKGNSKPISMTNCHLKNDINAIERSVSCEQNKLGSPV